LQVPWRQDAQDLLTLVAAADLVIVDHYALNANWQRYIQKALHCKLMVIDDLVRDHHADLILDQTLLRRADEYQPQSQVQASHDETKILAGCEFALLNPQFSHYRQQVLADDKLSDRPQLLLSMGGIDQPNASLQVLTALAEMPVLLRPLVTVLLGPRAPHYQQVQDFCQQNNDWITHLDFVDNMAELMLQHQVAIGAPGTTSWERACLGIPSIIIPLADNQQTISRNLVTVDAAYKVELDEITENLQDTYQALLRNWPILRQNNLRLCDGFGLNRVLKAIANLGYVSGLRLRDTEPADIQQVYKWQCHASTRRYALNQQVPSWLEHQEWMSAKLNQGQDYFYIITIPDPSDEQSHHHIDVGVVRLDRIAIAQYLLSIFIDPNYYGQGLAKQALAYLDELHPNMIIHAKVLTANTASQRLFTQSRFQRVTAESFIRHPLDF